jgi:hypothetical protein
MFLETLDTLDALYCTTIGGSMPAGMNARIEFVPATIWAIARSRFTQAEIKIFWTEMPFNDCASMSLIPLTLELREYSL